MTNLKNFWTRVHVISWGEGVRQTENTFSRWEYEGAEVSGPSGPRGPREWERERLRHRDWFCNCLPRRGGWLPWANRVRSYLLELDNLPYLHLPVVRKWISESERAAPATSAKSHRVDDNHKNLKKKVHQNASTGWHFFQYFKIL